MAKPRITLTKPYDTQKNLGEIPTTSPPTGAPNRGRVVLYRMALFSMTWVTTKTTPFSTFCGAFHISVTGEDRHFKFGG